MSDPTPAEIEAGAAALEKAIMRDAVPWAETVREYPRRADEIRSYVGAVLRAVLPDHDARVRAELGDAIAEQVVEIDRHVDFTAADVAETARAIGRSTPEVSTPGATMAERNWSDADRELVRFVINDCRYDEGSDEQADAVLDALTADGWQPPPTECGTTMQARHAMLACRHHADGIHRCRLLGHTGDHACTCGVVFLLRGDADGR